MSRPETRPEVCPECEEETEHLVAPRLVTCQSCGNRRERNVEVAEP